MPKSSLQRCELLKNSGKNSFCKTKTNLLKRVPISRDNANLRMLLKWQLEKSSELHGNELKSKSHKFVFTVSADQRVF